LYYWVWYCIFSSLPFTKKMWSLSKYECPAKQSQLRHCLPSNSMASLAYTRSQDWAPRGLRWRRRCLFGTCTGSATVAVHMNVTCRMGRKPWANHLPTWATEISSSRAGCYYQFVISCEEPSANNRLEISNVYVPTHCTKIDSFKKNVFCSR
jgi:hypothetical protein